MPVRAKVLVTTMIVAGLAILLGTALRPAASWLIFAVTLLAALLSSRFKVKRLSGSGSMSLNYPFVFLALMQLSLWQSCIVCGLSLLVQSRPKKLTAFALLQMVFNVSNGVVSTACGWVVYNQLDRHGFPGPLALVLVAALYFLINSIPVALVIGWSQRTPVVELWKSEFYWYLPFYLVGAVFAVAASMLTYRFGWATAALLAPVVYTVYRTYNAQVTHWAERKQHLEETEALHLRTIEGLAMAIEAKDHNTHEHLFRVRDYVTDLAVTMGLDEGQKKALQIAAFLHDIGKLAVPEHIINKPGKLTPEEFEKMKIHPGVGADILERVRFPYPVVPIVRSHHERWDGLGYPDGLKGEAIPLGARILSVVDCFDALASDRPYRKAMPIEQAMAIVKESAGTQFDPSIVALLESRYLVLEASLQPRDTFVALNLDVDVARGSAPAAGLEQDSADVAGGATAGQASTSAASLRLLAAASYEAQALFERSQSIDDPMNVQEVAAVMESRLRALIPFDCCMLYLRDGDVVQRRYCSDDATEAFTTEPIPVGDGLSGWVVLSGRPILNGNARVEPNYVAGAGPELHSAISVPLFDMQAQTFGALTLYTRHAEHFSRDHVRVLQAVEAKFSLALGNALRCHAVDDASDVDRLTRLPNNRGMFRTLDAELNRSRRSGDGLTLIVLQVHAMDRLNDAAGEPARSALLRAVAGQLKARCRNYDTVARVGADEFALLLPTPGEARVEIDTQWVQAAVDRARDEAGIGMALPVSMGRSRYPEDGDAAEELLAAASRMAHRGRLEQQRSMAPQLPCVAVPA